MKKITGKRVPVPADAGRGNRTMKSYSVRKRFIRTFFVWMIIAVCSGLFALPSLAESIQGETPDVTTETEAPELPYYINEDGVLTRYWGTEETFYVPNGVKKIGDHAIYGNKELKKLVLPDSVEEIGRNAIYGNTSLSSLTLSRNLKVIDDYGICWNTALKQLELPEGLIRVGDNGLSSEIERLRLPKSLKEFGWYPFSITTKMECYKGTASFQYLTDNDYKFDVIDARDIRTLSCSFNKTQFTYTGREIYPVITIRDNGKILQKCSVAIYPYYSYSKDRRICDFTVSEAKNPGKVTVVLKGRPGQCSGEFDGERRMYYTIVPRQVKMLSSGTKTSYTKVQLSWRKLEEAGYYEVQRRSGKKWKKLGKVTSAGITDRGLKADQTYLYRVRACFQSGKQKYYGKWSKTLKVHTNPTPKALKKTEKLITKGYEPKLQTKTAAVKENEIQCFSQFSDNKGRYCMAYLKGSYIYICRYNKKLKNVSTVKIKKRMSTVGAVGCDGRGYLYVVYGKSDEKGKGGVATVSVSKYSEQGKLIKTFFWKSASGSRLQYLDRDCTRTPFFFGTCTMTFSGRTLILNMARLMYNGHQSNTTLRLNTDTMKPEENQFSNYVSHSFDQDVLVMSDGMVLFLNHGDAYPRGFDVERYNLSSDNKRMDDPDWKIVVPFHFYGKTGNNWTGAEQGNLAEISSGYVYAGAARKAMTKKALKQSSNVFIQILDRDQLDSKLKGDTRTGTSGESGKITDKGILWLTNYASRFNARNVSVTAIKNDRLVVMWEKWNNKTGKYLNTCYAVVAANGKILQKAVSLGYCRLSSRKPIYLSGYLYWTGTGSSSAKATVYRMSVDKLIRPSLGQVTGQSARYVRENGGYNWWDPYVISVSWNKLPRADGYEIWRSTAPRGRYTRLQVLKGNDNVTYNDKSFKAGTTYYYCIRAYRKVNGKTMYGKFSGASGCTAK